MQLTISTVSILRVRSDVAASSLISLSAPPHSRASTAHCPSTVGWTSPGAAARRPRQPHRVLERRSVDAADPARLARPVGNLPQLRLHAVKGLRAPPRAGDAAGRVPTRLAQLRETGLLDVGDADHLEPRDLRGVAQLAEVEVEQRRRALLRVDQPTDGDGAQLGELVAHREVGNRRVLLDRLRQRDEACGVVAGGRAAPVRERNCAVSEQNCDELRTGLCISFRSTESSSS